MSTINVHRSDQRFLTDAGWLDSKHSFNFGNHWAAEHQGHGLLLVNNDDVVAGGQGFGTHGHRNMEIVTWVLSGRLEHTDSEGNHGVLYPGLAQRMSAGTGIRHSEKNASPDEPVHFVQMWVLPDTDEVAPGYEQRDVNDALAAGGLVAIASGAGHDGAVSLNQRDAVLWGARLATGDGVDVPAGGHVHVFIAVGAGTLESGPPDDVEHLSTGDAVRLQGTSDTAPLRFTATGDGAEVLVWVTA